MREVILFGIGLVIGYYWGKPEDVCPRELANWECKGDRCDHSEEAIRLARQIRH